MANEIVEHVVEQPPKRLAALDVALREAFGAKFDLWAKGASGVARAFGDRSLQLRPGDGPEDSHPSPEAPDLLDAMWGGDADPCAWCIAAGQYVLAIPFRRRGLVDIVATATFDCDSPEWLERAGSLFLAQWVQQSQVERLRDENEVLALQIGEDFEELTFLSRMASHLEVSELSLDLVEMAKTVVPLLGESIKAEGLGLVSVGPGGEDSASSRPSVGNIALWTGSRPIADEACKRLVERYRAAAERQPVVKNVFHRTPEGQAFPGVHSFMLVSVAKVDRQMGWLLALNRAHQPEENPNEPHWQLSHYEFGTTESTLLNSTAASLATHACNVDLFREKELLLTNVVRALASAVEAKDNYTCGHSERVALFGKRLAHELGFDAASCERLYLTGLLHDIGKIGVSDATLKKEGKLTDEEFAEIKMHPDKGWSILHDLEQLRYVLPGVLYHHERFDGEGYPDGLAGEAIPIDGRILAVADAYDAMTSDRPYRRGMPQEKAEAILRDGAGTQWDPRVIDAFFRAMDDILEIRKTYCQQANRQRIRGQIAVE